MTKPEPTLHDVLAAIQSLAVEMDTRFTAVDGRLNTHDHQFVEIRNQIATSHDQIIGRLERVEQELTFTNVTLKRHEAQLANIR